MRKIDKNDPQWCKGEGKVKELAKTAFSFKPGEGVSVYEVYSDLEEAMVLSAIALRCSSTSQPIFGLRLSWSELQKAKVVVKDSTGETGISYVDEKHFDLHSSAETFEGITEGLLERQKSGRDHVRKVHDRQIHHQWIRFQGTPDALDTAAQKNLDRVIARINEAEQTKRQAELSAGNPAKGEGTATP